MLKATKNSLIPWISFTDFLMSTKRKRGGSCCLQMFVSLFEWMTKPFCDDLFRYCKDTQWMIVSKKASLLWRLKKWVFFFDSKFYCLTILNKHFRSHYVEEKKSSSGREWKFYVNDVWPKSPQTLSSIVITQALQLLLLLFFECISELHCKNIFEDR